LTQPSGNPAIASRAESLASVPKHVGAALRLRQHDGIGTRRHDGIEVAVAKAACKSIDANQQARAVLSFAGIRDERRGAQPCVGLALRGN
jgi:hypothetical protein